MHVDDGLGGSNSSEFLRFIKQEIGKAFGIKDLGPVKEFLGVQFERDFKTRELWIHQEPYIDALLEEYGLTSCNPVSTPFDAAHPFGRKAFGIKDLGPVKEFLGVQFERDFETRELWIHQEPYIDALLEEYGLTSCNPVSTPFNAAHPFGRDTDVHPIIPNLVTAFQRLIGSLLFIQRHSHPDISVAVLLLSQHCSKLSPCHFAAGKRVLRYLSGTRSLRLHYGGGSSNVLLYGYSDADWAGDKVTRASTS
ncbi:hypothetical protein CVT25_001332, partial [Psilocybe cyanescens]